MEPINVLNDDVALAIMVMSFVAVQQEDAF